MKRSRAIKKTKDEEDLARQKEREISRYAPKPYYVYSLIMLCSLQSEIDQLEEQVDQQSLKIQRYKVYREYMERVLEYSQEVYIILQIKYTHNKYRTSI